MCINVKVPGAQKHHLSGSCVNPAEHSQAKWKTRRKNTPSEIPLLCSNSRVSCLLKLFYWDALCLFVARLQRYEGDAVLKRCSRCVTELISLTGSTLCGSFTAPQSFMFSFLRGKRSQNNICAAKTQSPECYSKAEACFADGQTMWKSYSDSDVQKQRGWWFGNMGGGSIKIYH